jgi:hypothetical protein
MNIGNLDTARAIATAKIPHGMQQSVREAQVPHQGFSPAQKALLAQPTSFKKGGKVKKSGWAKVHKGEKVITAAGRVMGGRKKKARRKKHPRAAKKD